MTITRRILLQIALAAGLVIAVATAVTYRLVLRSAEKQVLSHLSDYVMERSKAEETEFLRVQQNLEMVRELFLRRDAQPFNSNVDRLWEQRFEKFPDGATRSRKEFSDGRKYSTGWIHKSAVLTPALKLRILRAQDICNDFLPGWVDTFPSLYFVFPEQVNIGFDPRIPNWVWDAAADYDNNNIEAILVANPTNNPARKIVWGSAIEEPVSKVPYVNVALPIDRDGVNIGILGHDIAVRDLLADTARTGLDGVTHFVFRQDGRLIAHPALEKEILKSNGKFTLQGSDNPMLRSLYAAVAGKAERRFAGYEPTIGSYYAAARLRGPEWIFLSVMPASTVQERAYQSAQWILWSGLFSLALLMGLLSFILRRQIALPLAELSRATRQMSTGDVSARVQVEAHDDLGALARSFNTMAERVATRDAELRQLNQSLERRVDERTAELHRALARERELGELKGNFVSLVSHEFRTPLGVIMSATEVLQRYFDRLLPEKRARHLDMIFRSTKNLAHLIDGVLLLGRVEDGRMQFAPAPIDLAGLCRAIVDEIGSATNAACPVRLTTDASLSGAISDEDLVRHILTNLLSNAVKYSPPGSPVDLLVERRGYDAVFVVRDRGIGIPFEDQPRVFDSFTRGRNVDQRPGTGLGLVIVQRCVRLHGGQIDLESEPGKGTTVTVGLPVFRRASPEAVSSPALPESPENP